MLRWSTFVVTSLLAAAVGWIAGREYGSHVARSPREGADVSLTAATMPTSDQAPATPRSEVQPPPPNDNQTEPAPPGTSTPAPSTTVYVAVPFAAPTTASVSGSVPSAPAAAEDVEAPVEQVAPPPAAAPPPTAPPSSPPSVAATPPPPSPLEVPGGNATLTTSAELGAGEFTTNGPTSSGTYYQSSPSYSVIVPAPLPYGRSVGPPPPVRAGQ
jgi:hypothetical protein